MGFNFDLPDLFYDVITNCVPGGIFVSLYMPNLARKAYAAVNQSQSAVGSTFTVIIFLLVTWILGLTLSVFTSSIVFIARMGWKLLFGEISSEDENGELTAKKKLCAKLQLVIKTIFKTSRRLVLESESNPDDSWVLRYVDGKDEKRLHYTRILAVKCFFRQLFALTCIALVVPTSDVLYAQTLPKAVTESLKNRWNYKIPVAAIVFGICWYCLHKSSTHLCAYLRRKKTP
jgi:hypothetical protein